MGTRYLDLDGLSYLWQKIKSIVITDVTYDSSTNELRKVKNGSDSNIVTLSSVATSGSYNDLSNKPTIPEEVQKTTTIPNMDGIADIGSETDFAAGDHVHPTDTTRAPLESPAFTGIPTAPTAASGTNNLQIANTKFVAEKVDSKLASTAITTGSIDNIVNTGIYYVGNNVTGKPNNISGAGTGGMLIVVYVGSANFVKIFIRNANIAENFMYVKRVNGGADFGWTLIK